MFFTDWEPANPRIDRAYMDGKQLFTLATESVGLPSGITVDIIQQRVYWVDSKFDYVGSVDYNGKNRYVHISVIISNMRQCYTFTRMHCQHAFAFNSTRALVAVVGL